MRRNSALRKTMPTGFLRFRHASLLRRIWPLWPRPSLLDQPVLAATGQLELTVVDKDTGKPIPCRMHLVGPKKQPFKPDKVPFWHDHFVVPGKILLKLPVGQLHVRHRARAGVSRPDRPLHHQQLRRRHEAGRTAAVHRHGGRRLVVGRSGRATPGARHRTAHGGRRPARRRSHHLAKRQEPVGRPPAQGAGRPLRRQSLLQSDGRRVGAIGHRIAAVQSAGAAEAAGRPTASIRRS